jgi:CO/xanthine dehydrogenase Mo-binding subunit
MSDFKVVGKPQPFVDSRQKATGDAIYTTDIRLPGMLYGKILRSPIPHGRIVSIDTSQAESLPGVKIVITAKDTPMIRFGTTHEDWYLLAPDKVRFVGEEIAAVAAVDLETAEEALDLIKVEYEQLPTVYDPEEAMLSGAPLINEAPKNIASVFEVERGDVEEAFDNSYLVLEEKYYTSQVYQAYLETMAAVAKPEPDGRITLYLPIQIPSKCRVTYAKALGMPIDSLRIIQPPTGGGFGAKMETPLHPITALLAKLTGKPVRVVNTREEDFKAGNPRLPMNIYLKMGFTKDGIITAKKVRIVTANGGRVCYGVPIIGTASFRPDTLYKFQNVKAESYLVYTNTLPAGCFRGFGNSQMVFALESMMDQAAHQLGIDPIEMRHANAVHAGYVSVHGWQVKSAALDECLDKVAAATGWKEKKSQMPFGKGVGLACTNHVSGYSAFFPPFHGSSAVVRLELNGRASVTSGEVELGQGQKTAFAQIAAEVLGLTVDDIRIVPVDSDQSTFSLGAWASRTTTVGGKAVYLAAEDLKSKIIAYASALLEVGQEQLVLSDGKVVSTDRTDKSITLADLASRYLYQHNGSFVYGFGEFNPGTQVPDANKYGNPSCAYPFAAHVAEVEVDTETGQVQVVSYHAAHDLGRTINPLGASGQIEGGVAMGIGWALMEDLVYDQGKVANAGFLDYRVPGPKDMPEIKSIFVESNDPYGPFGAKGLGEPTLNPVAAAISNAIYDAVGVRLRELPFTPEKVLNELKKLKK